MQTTVNNSSPVRFRRFARKGYALFAALGKVVVIGVLSVPMLAKAETAQSARAHANTAADQRQEMPADTIDGEELAGVSVVGSLAPQAAGQSVRMVSVLDREQIASLPAQSIGDILKFATSVDVRQRGPLGAQADIGMRGGTNEQVAILLDGVNIGDPQTGHNTLLLPIDKADIERIEVLEGPAGRAYGTQSLLGAINIITRKGGDKTASARAEGGSYGYWQAAARWANRTGRANRARHPGIPDLSISASYTRSDGYTRSSSGNLNGDFQAVRAALRGGANVRGAELDWLAGVAVKDYGSNTFYGAKWDNQFEHVAKTFTQFSARSTGPLHLRATAYWNHSADRFELIRGDESGVPFNYHRSDVIGLSAGSHFDWVLGRTAFAAEMRNEDIVSSTLGEPLTNPNGRYDHGLNRTNIAFTAEHNIALGPLRLSAGVVAQRSSWGKDGMRLYPGADAALRLGPAWKLFAGWNTSLRLPTATELYYSVGGHKADKNLKAEKISSVELGARYLRGPVEASVRGFYNHYRDLIDWTRRTDAGPDAPWESVNFTSIDALGLQADATLRLPRLAAGLHYTYIHQSKDATPNLQSRYALEYLRHKLTATATARLGHGLALTVDFRFQERTGTFTDALGAVRGYQPYALWGARAEWSHYIYNVYVQADNIFGKRYFDFAAVPQPGRWIVAGVEVEI